MRLVRLAASVAFASLAVAGAAPAAAAVVVLASNVNLASGPFTFGVTPTDRFTLTFAPRGQFDPDPILVRTTGNAAVTSVFGAPSVSFTDPPALFGPASFPGFASVPTDTRAPFTLTASDLGLRYSIGTNNFFGYARFANANLISVAFENSPNTAILGGAVAAVPEPSTWAFMLIGFGAIGYSLRRRGQGRIAATA